MMFPAVQAQAGLNQRIHPAPFGTHMDHRRDHTGVRGMCREFPAELLPVLMIPGPAHGCLSGVQYGGDLKQRQAMGTSECIAGVQAFSQALQGLKVTLAGAGRTRPAYPLRGAYIAPEAA